MAHSIQIVGAKVLAFNDLDLMAVVCLVDRAIFDDPAAYPTLAPLVADWKQDLATYGPGTIDLKLDALTSSETARAELLSALTAVDAEARELGETVPASVISEGCKISGVLFYDYPTSALMTAIGQLRDSFSP